MMLVTRSATQDSGGAKRAGCRALYHRRQYGKAQSHASDARDTHPEMERAKATMRMRPAVR